MFTLPFKESWRKILLFQLSRRKNRKTLNELFIFCYLGISVFWQWQWHGPGRSRLEESARMGTLLGYSRLAIARLVSRPHQSTAIRGNCAAGRWLSGAWLHVPARQLCADMQNQNANSPFRHEQGKLFEL